MDTIIQLKNMRRAMQPYVLLLYEMTLELRPENVLEIGVRQAQSTRSILSALYKNGGGKLTSIDLRDRTERIPDFLLPFWSTVVGDSHSREIFESVITPGYSCSLLLIDGDHSYEGVKKDYELYSPYVKKGGYILLHDILNKDCGVPQFWDEIYKSNTHAVALNYGYAGMGIVQC
jgi:cephalosporin hydroxylase